MSGFLDKYTLSFFLFCLLIIPALGSIEDVEKSIFFKKINVEHGLSQASINCFYEDELGFIWIGTDDGLNRFDGKEFTIYKWQRNNTNCISNSTIFDISSDNSGNMWIATASGLNKYSLDNEVFTQYFDSTLNNYFSKLVIDDQNQRIWLAANTGGLKYLDLVTGTIESIKDERYSNIVIWEIIKIANDELLVGSLNNGIFKLSTTTMELFPFLNDTTSRFRLPVNSIRKLLKRENELFIGLDGGGVGIFNISDSSSKIISNGNSGLKSDLIFTMEFGVNNDLLIGTDGGGLSIYKKNEEVVSYQREEGNRWSLSTNVVRSIFLDSSGNTWIGTYNGGINFINKYSRNIYYSGRKTGQNSLSHNNVTGFVENDDGSLWIGTDGGGLNYLKDGIFHAIGMGNTEHNLNDNVVMCVQKADNGSLLIGTFRGGLNILKDGVIRKFTHDDQDNASISNNWIWDIEIDKNGNYWIGTNGGLNMFDPKKEEFTLYRPIEGIRTTNSKNNIRSLLIDSNYNLWIGSFGGMGKFNLKSRKFEYFIDTKIKGSGLNNDIITSFHEDKDKNLWVGSFGGGLFLFNEETKSFTSFDDSNGMPSNGIQSIEEDDHDNLWISAMNGLVKFNIESKAIQVLDPSFGLQGEVFKYNASYRSKDGFMYFGGINGFNYFHPDSITFPKISESIVFTDFKLFNTSIKPTSQGDILKKNINYTDQISLKYDDSRFFSIHFTVPNFTYPDKLRFSYMLEGFSDQWNDIGKERKVSFTNLDPGDYIFKVRVSDNNLWPDNYSTLKLSIVPPFYLRFEFIAFSFILLVLSGTGVFTYRIMTYRNRQLKLERLVDAKNKEIKKQYEELRGQNLMLTDAQKQLKSANNSLEEKVKMRTKTLKKTVDKLNKSVVELDRFVYSASHDLSAPLKSIQGLVNIARIENREGNLNVHLDYIEQSIAKLEDVIKELIQYSRNSRAELGIVKIELKSFVAELIKSFKFLTEFKLIKFDISIPEKVFVWTDIQRLQMILHNIISNSIKYYDKEKTDHWVRIRFSKSHKNWKLIIEDNGIGISEDQKNKVFQMFYRATELSDGSGLGLFIVKEAVEKLNGKVSLVSEEGEGSSFILRFPNNPKD